MGNVREDLFKLLVVVAAELDIPPIEYAFVPMIMDDSKLILKPKGIILINEKFKDNLSGIPFEENKINYYDWLLFYGNFMYLHK